MNTYAYEAVNAAGLQSRGILEVASQSEALRRIKEMGLFPTRVAERRHRTFATTSPAKIPRNKLQLTLFPQRVKPAAVAVLTRQIATLVDAGLPLVRGLKILREQESNTTLQRVLAEIANTIEGGSLFSEALAAHPKIFNKLYVNMVRAGEASGALDVALHRLAEFMEKAQKIKGKVQSALFYPAAVTFVAAGVLTLMLVWVIPRFKEVFSGLTNGAPLPAFTEFVLGLSDAARHRAPTVGVALATLLGIFILSQRTTLGRFVLDLFKLRMPLLGPVFRKSAISRFARTLSTLMSSGVPILQSLQIVRETAGNLVVGRMIARIHESVKQGETISEPIRASHVFPPLVVGMVDIGEQTGALPDMLLKVADNYDDEVDNAVNAMTSLLEPIMIVFLAVIVGSIVCAMFLPIIGIMTGPGIGSNDAGD